MNLFMKNFMLFGAVLSMFMMTTAQQYNGLPQMGYNPQNFNQQSFLPTNQQSFLQPQQQMQPAFPSAQNFGAFGSPQIPQQNFGGQQQAFPPQQQFGQNLFQQPGQGMQMDSPQIGARSMNYPTNPQNNMPLTNVNQGSANMGVGQAPSSGFVGTTVPAAQYQNNPQMAPVQQGAGFTGGEMAQNPAALPRALDMQSYNPNNYGYAGPQNGQMGATGMSGQFGQSQMPVNSIQG